MFQSLKTDVLERFSVLRQHFDAVGVIGSPAVLATSRGMAFVQMYAVWEYTVKSSVKAATNSVCASGIPLNGIRLELTSLLLHSKLMSVSSSGKETYRKILEFLRGTQSGDIPISHDAFPSDGSHYRLPQIYLIWEVFGISAPVVPDLRLTNLVGEVIEHRHAIAHGRETPQTIGRRFSKEDIRRKIDEMEQVCFHVISTLEIHCSSTANFVR